MLCLRFAFAAAFVMPSFQLQLGTQRGVENFTFDPVGRQYGELMPQEDQAQLNSQISQDLKKFIAASQKDLVSVVFAGDNNVLSMSSAMRFLLGDNATIRDVPEIVTKRADYALRIINAKSCTMKTGEHVYHWVGRFEGETGPMVAFYFVHLHTSQQDDIGCFEDCIVDAFKVLQPDAMMWTFGLHLEHRHPQDPCVKGYNGAVNCFRNCGDYTQLVARSARILQQVSPLLIWRTTYSVCERKLPAEARQVLFDWHHSSTRGSMERAARRDCGLPPSGWNWADMLQDDRSGRLQGIRAMAALRTISPDISILDAYLLTKNQCQDNEGGFHFPRVAMIEAGVVASILGRGVKGIRAP